MKIPTTAMCGKKWRSLETKRRLRWKKSLFLILVLLDKVMLIMSVTYNFKEDGDNIGKDEKLG